MKTKLAVAFLFVLHSALSHGAEGGLQLDGAAIRVQVLRPPQTPRESILIKNAERWTPALFAESSATQMVAGSSPESQVCPISSLEKSSPTQFVVHSECRAGRLDRTLALNSESDVVLVSVRFTPNGDSAVYSVEDGTSFLRNDALRTH